MQTPDYTDSQVSSAELKSGTYDAGTDVARSYLKFEVSAFKGKHITHTNLALYSYYSSTCSTSGSGTVVRRVTGSWDSSSVTWSPKPAGTTNGQVINTAAKGYSSSCPAGTMNCRPALRRVRQRARRHGSHRLRCFRLVPTAVRHAQR
ncbi:DNRLRE domain-containing protein [Streptomyces sp. NPDC004237]|uniref:DNRLRE domain-containing protein n=1 Tax=Streptomyces sp. NPDC004237 TaxID=3154455 RepID=UPI0033AAFFE1